MKRQEWKGKKKERKGYSDYITEIYRAYHCTPTHIYNMNNRSRKNSSYTGKITISMVMRNTENILKITRQLRNYKDNTTIEGT